jgi:hypothetical protein
MVKANWMRDNNSASRSNNILLSSERQWQVSAEKEGQHPADASRPALILRGAGHDEQSERLPAA